MTIGDKRKAAIEQLEDALSAEDEETKNFHIREALQLLQLTEETVSANDDSVDEGVK